MSRHIALGLLILSVVGASAQGAREGAPPPAQPTLEQVPAAMANWFGQTVDNILEPVTGPDETAAPPAVAHKHKRTDHN